MKNDKEEPSTGSSNFLADCLPCGGVKQTQSSMEDLGQIENGTTVPVNPAPSRVSLAYSEASLGGRSRVSRNQSDISFAVRSKAPTAVSFCTNSSFGSDDDETLGDPRFAHTDPFERREGRTLTWREVNMQMVSAY